jgi:proteic killer suppression protein
MIVSTRGKLAAGAVQDRFGKGFPADIVKRTRAMLSALDAAVELEDLRFPPGNHLEACLMKVPAFVRNKSHRQAF